MLNKIFALTQFKNLWLVLPLLLAVLYAPQAMWGLHIFGDKAAVQLILIISLGLLVYFGTYLVLQKVEPIPFSEFSINRWNGLASTYFVALVSILYFSLIGYVLLTAEKIALLEALRDSSVEQIAFAREALFKTRLGWEKTLPYLNAILSTALMPFAVALAYLSRMSYRHWLLLFFCLSLLISLEKALILKALLPVIAIGFQSQFSRKKAVILVLLLVGVVGALFYFTKMGKIDYQGQAKESIAKLEQQLIDLPEIKRKNFQDIENSIKANEEAIALFDRQLADLPRIKQKNLEAIDRRIRSNSALIRDLESKLKNMTEAKRKNTSASERVYLSPTEHYGSFASNMEKTKAAREEVKRSNRLLQDQREKNIKYYTGYKEGVEASRLQAKLSIQTLQDQRVENVEYYEKYVVEVRAAINSEKMAYETHYKYNVFTGGQAGFALNRLAWIPYVTAYDWLKYFDERLHNQFLGGSSSFLVSHILGIEKFPIEREVFKYQFGDGGPQTGSANALFLVDAFVNFGWVGVVAYAFLLALIVFLIYAINNPAMMACLYFYLVQAANGGLLGILFGNGLILLIFLSFFVRPKAMQRNSGESGV